MATPATRSVAWRRKARARRQLRRGEEASSRDRAAPSRLTLSDDNFNPLVPSEHVRPERGSCAFRASFRPPRVVPTPHGHPTLLPKSHRNGRFNSVKEYPLSVSTAREESQPLLAAAQKAPRCASIAAETLRFGSGQFNGGGKFETERLARRSRLSSNPSELGLEIPRRPRVRNKRDSCPPQPMTWCRSTSEVD